MLPMVSIVMSVYNGEPFLWDAINSILRQTYPEIEFIILNDGSLDSSSEILKAFASEDARIQLIEHKENLGLTVRLNEGWHAASGKYIARMDADDISLSDRLSMQVDYLENNPDVGVLGTQMNVVNEDCLITEKYEVPISHDQIAWALMFNRSFAHPSVMIRRSILEQAGGYDATFRVSQDHELWTRLIWLTRFANLPEVLVNYRSHASATSIMDVRMQASNVLEARKRLGSRILEKDIPLDLIGWMEQSQLDDHRLPDAIISQVVTTIFDLYHGYNRKNLFTGEALEGVRSDMVRNVIRASRSACEADARQSIPPEGTYFHLKRIIPPPIKKIIRGLISGKLDEKNTPTLSNISNIKRPVVKKENGAIGISIIVLSYERMKSLELMLGSLLRQKMDNIKVELIVCNNSPRVYLRKSRFSGVGRMLQKFPDVRIINSSHNWSTDIRFSLATLAKNNIVLFLDDDLILLDNIFIAYMFDSFQKLGTFDILSCWNMLWVEWHEDFFSGVSLDFNTPEITGLTKSDLIGPGICMFNKKILTPNVLQAVMPVAHREADDMGFPLAAYLEHKSESYYLPSYRMIEFHMQSQHEPMYARPGHYAVLYALYKEMLSTGYAPVLSRLSAQEYETSNEKRAVDLLEKMKFAW